MTMKDTRPKRKCQDCRYYPEDCGYWNYAHRTANTASFLSALAIHNCQDYAKRPKEAVHA